MCKYLTSAYKATPKNLISKLYNALLNAKNDDTLNIKEKWEKEAGIRLTEEAWEEVCTFQWSSTSSVNWREHCWKNIMRYFKTPYQEKYKNNNQSCWRQCGSVAANHCHVFWDCPKLYLYWKGIHKTLTEIFKIHIPLNFENLYLGRITGLTRRSDIKLLQALLAASKKSITRKWLKPEPPELEEWCGITVEIFRMEKLTYSLRTQRKSSIESGVNGKQI